MGYPENQDVRTGKAPKHQAAAETSGNNISNAEIIPANKIDLFLGTCENDADYLLGRGWNPHISDDKILYVTSLESSAELFAKKKSCNNTVIKVINIPYHILKPDPQYNDEYNTEELIKKINKIDSINFILTTYLPKEHFIALDTIPNMPDMIDMDSPEFIIRNDKKSTPYFLREIDLNDYLHRTEAKDVERMFYIERNGSILGVPDNTKIYMARFSRNNSYTAPWPSWNLRRAEIVEPNTYFKADNYDRDTLKSIWDSILERRGWEITDITDEDYDQIIITLESQDASGTMTSDDMEYNVEFIKELENTKAFQDILININDSAYIVLECTLYPE